MGATVCGGVGGAGDGGGTGKVDAVGGGGAIGVGAGTVGAVTGGGGAAAGAGSSCLSALATPPDELSEIFDGEDRFDEPDDEFDEPDDDAPRLGGAGSILAGGAG